VVVTVTVSAYDSGEWITWGNEPSPPSVNPPRGSSSTCWSGPNANRAALIARLHVRDDAAWLAELLMDLEDDVGEIARLRLAASLREHLGS
jgi:hypothetical protein